LSYFVVYLKRAKAPFDFIWLERLIRQKQSDDTDLWAWKGDQTSSAAALQRFATVNCPLPIVLLSHTALPSSLFCLPWLSSFFSILPLFSLSLVFLFLDVLS
jgi:hypothetical protein